MTATPDNASLNIAVLGAGSWGTALAALMARNGHAVTLWGRDQKVAAAIGRDHENPRYLPGIPLPDNLRAGTDLAAVKEKIFNSIKTSEFEWWLKEKTQEL